MDVCIFRALKLKISMNLKISKAAQLYFALTELGSKELSFTTAYRIKRNIDHLKAIGEKYSEEMKAEYKKLLPVKEEYQDAEIKYYSAMADASIYKKWDESGEEEELDLKVLSFENEDIKFSARQIEALEPILTVES
jgi:hypothetical protein